MAARLFNPFQSQCLRDGLSHHLPPSFLAPILQHSFSTSSSLAASHAQKKIKSKHLHDIYATRQANLRKEANLRRQALLNQTRAQESGDPIRGVETDFVKSFDYNLPKDPTKNAEAMSIEAVMFDRLKPAPSSAETYSDRFLDHGLTRQDLADAIVSARKLTKPLRQDTTLDVERGKEDIELERWQARDLTATEALQRITSLANSSSKHRTKKNIQMIIDTFGRHKTDHTLRPRQSGKLTSDHPLEATPRAGKDTGSSEVQIGILTAKIRVLADRHTGKGRRDKVNKRNLRLLLHRRQKLLKYMHRRERGSERWQNMLTTLGLTPATWQGEISVQ